MFNLLKCSFVYWRPNCIQKASETTVTNPLGCAFVMEQSDTKGIPGTVVCGVCGAVRRYSFILQARKFGTFSCEPCRKFISRVLRARVPVKCSVGSGTCINPPVHRWNNSFPTEDKPSIPMLSLMEIEPILLTVGFFCFCCFKIYSVKMAKWWRPVAKPAGWS